MLLAAAGPASANMPTISFLSASTVPRNTAHRRNAAAVHAKASPEGEDPPSPSSQYAVHAKMMITTTQKTPCIGGKRGEKKENKIMLFDSSDKKAVVARGVKRRVPEAYDGDVDQTGLPKVNGHRLCITTPLGRRAAAHGRHRRRVRTCAYLEIQSIRVKSRHLVPVLKFRFGLFSPPLLFRDVAGLASSFSPSTLCNDKESRPIRVGY